MLLLSILFGGLKANCHKIFFFFMIVQYSHEKCPQRSTVGNLYLIEDLDRNTFSNYCIKNEFPASCKERQISKDWGCSNYDVMSSGAADPGYSRNYVGLRIDGKIILNKMQRGFHIFQYEKGQLKSLNIYDSYGFRQRNIAMAKELSLITNGTLIVLLIDDTITLDNAVKDQLRSIGATNPNIEFRQSYCLVSIKGFQQQKIVENRRDEKKGPCYCRTTVWYNRNGYFIP